jgi:hypothetical protein
MQLVVPDSAFWPSLINPNTTSNMTSNGASPYVGFVGLPPVGGTCVLNFNFTFTYAAFLAVCANGEQFIGTVTFGVLGPSPSVNGNGGYGSSFWVQQSYINTTTLAYLKVNSAYARVKKETEKASQYLSVLTPLQVRPRAAHGRSPGSLAVNCLVYFVGVTPTRYLES